VWSHFNHTGDAVWWCARRGYNFQKRALNDQLMKDGIENQLTPIRDVSDRIAAGAGTLANLSDLRTSLVEILERRERDPGIEAAAHDVYEGAVAIVESGTPPTHRQQRLLREATQRFEERLQTRWEEGATRPAS
jgi:hypothetical protein